VSTLSAKARLGTTVQLTIKLRVLALLAVLFFTLAVGFTNSLNVEYGGTYTTFLLLPTDLPADLIRHFRFRRSTTQPYSSEIHEHNFYGGQPRLARGELEMPLPTVPDEAEWSWIVLWVALDENEITLANFFSFHPARLSHAHSATSAYGLAISHFRKASNRKPIIGTSPMSIIG
jgi:hypothetical protein